MKKTPLLNVALSRLIASLGHGDMVVIGARGQGALSSALLGSVSQELVHASPVPVTVVKHAEVLEEGEEGEEDAEPST